MIPEEGQTTNRDKTDGAEDSDDYEERMGWKNRINPFNPVKFLVASLRKRLAEKAGKTVYPQDDPWKQQPLAGPEKAVNIGEILDFEDKKIDRYKLKKCAVFETDKPYMD